MKNQRSQNPADRESPVPARSIKERRVSNRFRILFVLGMVLVLASQLVDFPDPEAGTGRVITSVSLIMACGVLLAYLFYFTRNRIKRKK